MFGLFWFIIQWYINPLYIIPTFNTNNLYKIIWYQEFQSNTKVLKQIYLPHWWDPNMSGPESYSNEEIHLRTPGASPLNAFQCYIKDPLSDVVLPIYR